MTKNIVFIALLVLAGCSGPLPQPGAPRTAVIERFGQPTATYPTGTGELLEYANGPMGQQAWMVQLGADGHVVSAQQVLTNEKFASLKVGSSTQDEVLRTVGRPAETSYLSLPQLLVWSYRYRDGGVWNSMMHRHFDQAGILRKMVNGPDPMYEEHGRRHWR